MNKLIKLLLCLTFILSACQNQSIEKLADVDNVSTIVKSSKDGTKQTVEAKYLISSEGIGKAKLGMTLGELKQAVDRDTKFELKSPFMVDINAIAVTKMDEVQYYILFFSDTTLKDSDPITYLMTQNPRYQTKEKIKVGSTIRQAEDVYGNATLAYNIINESREYVNFANLTSSNLGFRPNQAKYQNGFAGIYPEKIEEYNQTENYREDAAIAIIEIACSSQDCP